MISWTKFQFHFMKTEMHACVARLPPLGESYPPRGVNQCIRQAHRGTEFCRPRTPTRRRPSFLLMPFSSYFVLATGTTSGRRRAGGSCRLLTVSVSSSDRSPSWAAFVPMDDVWPHLAIPPPRNPSAPRSGGAVCARVRARRVSGAPRRGEATGDDRSSEPS